ncbi:hypothetical protein FBQ82_15565 [Anaerolineae bacterium CFX7]|nr:hypothetical protein [Anaerolineae bacterium CFX7]
MSDNALVETWNIHNRIHLYVLDALKPDALAGAALSKGRSVGQQFAHIHNVRLAWLNASAPELMKGLKKIEKEAEKDKARLKKSLDESGEAIAALIEKSGAANGKVKGFKPHVTAFVGYLISHESYHRGEIGILLTQSGNPLDKKTAYGMWEWGVR